MTSQTIIEMTEPEFRSEPDFRSEPECDGYLQERTIDLWWIYGSCYNNHDTTMIHITGSNKNDEIMRLRRVKPVMSEQYHKLQFNRMDLPKERI